MSTSNEAPRLLPKRPPPPPPVRRSGPPRWLLPVAAGSIALIALAAGVYFIRLPRGQPAPARTPSAAPVQVTSLYFVSDQVGWVGTLLANTSGGPVLATTDGGKHWTRQLPLPTSAATWMRFFDSRHGYSLEVPFGAPGSPPVLYGTADGGGTWTRIETPPNEFGGASADFADFQHGWFATYPFDRRAGPFKLYSTSDGGARWQELVSVGPAQQESHGVRAGVLSGFWFADATHGWLMASEPGRPLIYFTEDGGHSWTRQELTVPLGVGPNDPFFLSQPFFREGGSGVVGVFTLDASVIYSTKDMGRSWSPPRPLPTSNPPHLVMPDATHVWAAIDTTLWASTDFGTTWQRLATLAGEFVFGEVAALDSSHAWAAAVMVGPCPGDVTARRCITNSSPGQLLRSTDGGKHWSNVVLPA